VNQAEARRIEDDLEQAGLRRAGEESPDLIVLHSCAVTAEAESQSAQALRRLRSRFPSARLIWSGCGAGRHADPATADVVIAPGPGWIREWNRILTGLHSVRAREPATDDPGLRSFGGRVRAFLKVQDGCDLTCAYCIVPSLRGPSRDRPVADVLKEARTLVNGGCPELVVTGVSVGLYGRRGGTSLPELLKRLTDLPGLERIRLSSLHPAEVDADLLRVWREGQARIMPHLHLPLQSGSDSVLKKMRRGYTVQRFCRAVDQIRNALERPGISTDLIAGFPGETEDDARASEALCERIGFSKIHVFPFSSRPGTEAGQLPDPVPGPIIRSRARSLRNLSDRLALRTYQTQTGAMERVLVESKNARKGHLSGYTERYLPAHFPGPAEWIGSLQSLRITGADPEGLRGLPCAGEPARVSP
jgi:threonylcarbamoyladenosine tRNA methylthiotransferase MtaB